MTYRIEPVYADGCWHAEVYDPSGAIVHVTERYEVVVKDGSAALLPIQKAKEWVLLNIGSDATFQVLFR